MPARAARYHSRVLGYFCRTALVQAGRYRAQSLLAMLGVAIGVANVIMLISIADLGRHQTLGFMRGFGADLVIVTPFFNMQSGGNMLPAQASQFLPLSAYDAVRRVPQVETAATAMFLPAHVGWGAKRWFTTLMGVTWSFVGLRMEGLEKGRWFTQQEESEHARVACIGDTVRQKLFGESSGIGEEIVVRGQRYTVIGTMRIRGRIGLEDTGNRVFIPLSTAQEAFHFKGVHVVFARYRHGAGEAAAVRAIKGALRGVLKPGEALDDVFSVFTLKDAQRLMESTLNIFRLILGCVASIALVVAGIGIMNVMLMRVLSRRKEIGIRRAVGASAALVLMQFLVESIVQSLIGAAAGIALGVGGVAAYCAFADWDMFISPLTVAVAFSAVMGIVFGAYPAYRAARLDPIRCLHE